MKKLMLVCILALCLPVFLVACGGEEPPDEPTVSDPASPPADDNWYPEDDDGSGAPNGGSIFDPCTRAACWDWDRRAWVSDPPWDGQAKKAVPVVNPVDLPQLANGMNR